MSETSLEKFTTLAPQLSALDELIKLAQREICLFDYDLHDTGWNRVERIEVLRQFLLVSRANRLRIAVHDTNYLSIHCSRMLSLLRTFSHAFTLHRTLTEAKHVHDPFLLIDTRHYWHRFHYQHARAEVGILQPETVQLMRKRFEEIWLASEPGITATVLGL